MKPCLIADAAASIFARDTSGFPSRVHSAEFSPPTPWSSQVCHTPVSQTVAADRLGSLRPTSNCQHGLKSPVVVYSHVAYGIVKTLYFYRTEPNRFRSQKTTPSELWPSSGSHTGRFASLEPNTARNTINNNATFLELKLTPLLIGTAVINTLTTPGFHFSIPVPDVSPNAASRFCGERFPSLRVSPANPQAPRVRPSACRSGLLRVLSVRVSSITPLPKCSVQKACQLAFSVAVRFSYSDSS